MRRWRRPLASGCAIILPESNLLRTPADRPKAASRPSLTCFASRLTECGGIWSDADLLCLKPFDELPEARAGQVCKFTPVPPNHEVCGRSLPRPRVRRGQSFVRGHNELLTRPVRRRPNSCEWLSVDQLYAPLAGNLAAGRPRSIQYKTCSARLATERFKLTLDGVTGLCQVRGALGSCLVVVPRFDGVN